MKQTKWRLISFVCVFAVIALTSCGEGDRDGGTRDAEGSFAFHGYPIQTDTTLTYWMGLNSLVAPFTKDFGETEFAKALEKQTGVKVIYRHPAQGQEKEQFNLMLASKDLPDLIKWDWLSDFPGGPDQAIKSGYITPLNDYFTQNSPNLKAYLDAHPDVDRNVKTDTGNYFFYPSINAAKEIKTYMGPVVRKDWLEELHLPIPETIDDWYTMLTAFRDQKGASAPLSYTWMASCFIGAYGIDEKFYLDDGEIKYGPVEPGYKEFLTTYHKWFAEKLLDQNIGTVDSKLLDMNVLTGKTGASVSAIGSTLGRWAASMAEQGKEFNMIAVPYPALNRGEKVQFAQVGQNVAPTASTAISQNCGNKELAAAYLDYGYSEAGHMLYCFGTEGVSYTMENGAPRYTDLIMKNPDGIPPVQTLANYTHAIYGGCYAVDFRPYEQYYGTQAQKDALRIFADTDAEQHLLPPITLTTDESDEVSGLITDINTYVDEMFLKFVMGIEPLSNYDAYVANIKRLKLDRVIEVYQAALKRYYER
ncbi:MAG: extracellular solute-binding protein [Clostridiales bacterium]|jgi:putative aldouronate transport system substrate-binding protein|nr:extracellular solute-binding protein [Clostridiales bacterium]